jgi:hypothetical protein
VTNNYPELCGVYTQLNRLLYEYNMATREGTLKQMANRLKEIGDLATAAEGVATQLIFPPKVYSPPPEEDE